MSSRATEERNSLEASRALLAAELAREREHTLAGRLEARWRELALSPRTASPEELTAIARYFDDGRLEVALQGYTRALERHLLRDGVVTPRFGDFPSLEAWGRTIRASSALSLSPAGARLLVLEHGHRLTLPGARPEPLPPLLRASLPENPGTVLEEGMTDPGSGLPIIPAMLNDAASHGTAPTLLFSAEDATQKVLSYLEQMAPSTNLLF